MCKNICADAQPAPQKAWPGFSKSARSAAAGQRFHAGLQPFAPALKKALQHARRSPWTRYWLPVLATAAVADCQCTSFELNRERRDQQHLMSELADLHVATLASSNPVDVVSTDRHTVKPWFEGKIPFTFNLPELQDSPFVLVGGRVSYLNQSPGAELIFRVRQHQISVFIFQEKDMRNVGSDGALAAHSFGVRSWSHSGLRYFVIGDASAQDLDKLSELLKSAA